MEDHLNFFLEMEDNLNLFGKSRTTSTFLNGRQSQLLVIKIVMQPETFKIETMVVAPLRET